MALYPASERCGLRSWTGSDLRAPARMGIVGRDLGDG
jgi:hypothetical protein